MNTISNSVDALKWFFTTIMALAVTESLKQFVEEIKKGPDGKKGADSTFHLRVECIPLLLTLLMLATCFMFGMTRYFFEAYTHVPPTNSYALPLLFDTVAFTLEGICFFVMARSLSVDRCRVFAWTAIVMLAVDLTWVLKCTKWLPLVQNPTVPPSEWLTMDMWCLGILFVFTLASYTRFVPRWLLIAVLFVVLVGESATDVFYFNWQFYFPPTTSPPGQVVGAKKKTTLYFAGPLFTQAEWTWNAATYFSSAGHGL